MNTDANTCDPAQLDKLLAGDLTPGEQSRLSDHLDQCADCARRLESAAAAGDWWQAANEFLSGASLPLSTSSAAMPDAGADPDVARVLNQLAPTDDPHSLGRLGGYEVNGVVGSGGMGTVLKAFDQRLDRFVAIKTLHPNLAASGAARERFRREAKAAAAVVHDHVVEIYGVDEVGGSPYLVMPYIRGASLQRRLDESGPLAVDEVLRIAHQTARGLAAAHAQGLVHRDIKPANILLADGVERVRITDFGLARAGDDASITNSGVIAGTPQYMSPEQARGDTIDQRSDLFSLGSVVYAMCTGLPPFTASTGYGVLRKITDSEPRPVIEVNSSMPPWLDKIVLRLLAKTPDDRFQSASEVGDLLEQCLAHVQQPTKHPLPSYCRTSQPGASLTRLGALGATAVAVTLAAFWYSRGGDESTEQQPAATQSGQSEPFSFPPETAWLDQAEELQDIDVETRELDARSQRDFDYSVTPPSVNP